MNNWTTSRKRRHAHYMRTTWQNLKSGGFTHDVCFPVPPQYGKTIDYTEVPMRLTIIRTEDH
jgi:hypothetical protein